MDFTNDKFLDEIGNLHSRVEVPVVTKKVDNFDPTKLQVGVAVRFSIKKYRNEFPKTHMGLIKHCSPLELVLSYFSEGKEHELVVSIEAYVNGEVSILNIYE